MSSQNTKPSVLVLTFTPIKSEPRALKQIVALREKYNVTSAGFGEAPFDDVAHIELQPEPKASGFFALPYTYGLSLLFRLYTPLTVYGPRPASAYNQLKKSDWDIIIAHDVLTVPLARRLKPRHGVLADLHEYAPRQDEHSAYFRQKIAPMFRWILKKHVSKCEAATTVGQGIVKEYKSQFGIDSTLVVNATPFQDLSPTVTNSPIKLVHSGIPAPARKLEVMIEAVKQTTSDVTLDLFLMNSNDQYLAELKSLAGDSTRINFRDPVTYSQLLGTLHKYDVGLSLIAPTTFNLAWCLPNKFFDFVQARLGVIIGPSPEMLNYVEKYGFGIAAEDFTSAALTRTLDDLTPEIVDAWKTASHRNALELSGEKQAKIWVDLVDRLANNYPENAQ